MDNKAKYRDLCKNQPNIPVFSKDWWLDAVCEKNWDVCLVEKGKQITAAMPYQIRKRHGFTMIEQPPMTQTLGPWIIDSDAKYTNRLSLENGFLKNLIEQLPPFDHFEQFWYHERENWLPFFWKDFYQTTRYTYRINNLTDLDKTWSDFRKNVRGHIRKAENRFNLQVTSECSIDDFLKLNIQTFERQSIRLPYSKQFIKKIDSACIKNNACKIFIAADEEGRHHAGAYVVWDNKTVYYIMGGGNPDLRNSGAQSLCMWEAIKFASSLNLSFDFEGSMIEPIERFFRNFGAIQTPFFCIYKTNSKLIKIRKFLRRL